MKKCILIGIMTCWGMTSSAQLIPSTNQAFQLAPAFNPAFTGIENFTSIKLGYRSQWSSFPGAPKYLNLIAQTRLKSPFEQTYNALKAGEELTEDEIPKGQRLIHGIGGTLLYETNGQGGLMENMAGGITYAIHYPLIRKTYLSVGASFNYSATKIRWDKLGLDGDDLVSRASGSPISNMNVRVGFVVYSPEFYIHGAYYQLYSKTTTEVLDLNQGYQYKFCGGAGVRLLTGSETELRPGVGVLMDEFDNIDIDYSLKLYLNNGAWGGFMYRDNGFASLILGFEINSLIGVSYSYEIATGGLRGFNKGSNEIIVGLKLNNLRKVNPYLW